MNKEKVILVFLFFLNFSGLSVHAQVLSVEGHSFYLDKKPFDMWGVRVASATQSNDYTNSLISNLDDYKAAGINSISVFLQGSSGGYTDPFENGGLEIQKDHWKRLNKIIKASSKRDMVVIVGIFYQRTLMNPEICNLKSEKEIRNAVRTVSEKLKPYRNIIINIANEQNSSYYKEFKAFDFNKPENIISLCEEVKKVDSTRIVGGGGYHDGWNVVIGKSEFVDVLLFDTFSKDVENGHHSGWHYDYFLEQGVPDKPIVNVELFGGWTGKFMPQGVYSDEGKEVHYKEIEAAKKRPGLYIHLHSNPWFQGMAQDLPNRFELGGDGTIENPGVRWWYEYAQSPENTAVLTLDATSDFDLELPDTAPFYVDRNKWKGYIAINPLEYEDKWGGAQTEFTGVSGEYNIELISSPEIDGQSSYQLFVAGKKQGEFTHEYISKKEQEKAVPHVWKDIKLINGDILEVRAKSHSNKLIPEEGAPGGFAWSRARWSALKLYPKSYGQLPVNLLNVKSKVHYTPQTLGVGSVTKVGIGNRPDIAVDKHGNIHVVFARAQVLYYKKWDAINKKWGEDENTSIIMGNNKSYVTRADPDIVISSDNEVCVMAWNNFAKKKGSDWLQIPPVSNKTLNYRDTEMAIDSNDNIYLIKRGGFTGGKLGIQKLANGAIEWEVLNDPDMNLDTEGISDHVYPDLVIDDADNIHIVQRHGPGKTTFYHCSRDGGKSWTHSTVCESEPESPFIEILSDGTVIVAEGHGNYYRLQDGKWIHEGQQVPCEAREYPEMSVDKQDNLYSVAYGFKYNIRAKGRWGEPSQLFGLSNTKIGFVESSGWKNCAYVVWEEGAECSFNDNPNIGPKPVSIFIGKLNADGSVSGLAY